MPLRCSDLLLANDAKSKNEKLITETISKDIKDFKKILSIQANTMLKGFESMAASMQLMYKTNVELKSVQNTEIISELKSRIEAQDIKINKIETELSNFNKIPQNICQKPDNNVKSDKTAHSTKMSSKPQTPKMNIPVPVNPDFSNTTLNNANAYLKAVKVKRKLTYFVSESTQEDISKNITEKIENKQITKLTKPITTAPKYVSIEERNSKIEFELNKMSRTLGIRVGNSNIIQDTKNNLISMNKMDMSLSDNNQNIAAMKSVAQYFVINNLKISKENWTNTEIEAIWQDTNRDSTVINIRFKIKQDIAKINSLKKNIFSNSKNCVYQYVCPPLKDIFLAWETAAYSIRQESNQTVNTRIRAGQFDLFLLVRQKKVIPLLGTL